MSHENFDFQTSWNLRFPPLEPETSSLFLFDTSVDIALKGRLYDKLIQLVYFLAKNFVCRFLIFAYRGHLKVCDLKLLCLSQLCSLKDWKIKIGF
jgi:hypothetical protein